jgi:hypothetical protein
MYRAGNALSTAVLINKPPKWSDLLGACVHTKPHFEITHTAVHECACRYCLNFGGRVTVASVKNFQMCYEENVEPVLLQVSFAPERAA